MSIINIAGYKKHSFVDGPGIRFTIFTQGCPHACPSCHNPETWSCDFGTAVDTDVLIDEIRRARFLDGITISGGDPMMQAGPAAEIAKAAKEEGLSVWVYTGFTWEALLKGEGALPDREAALSLLAYTDVLVDGRFIVSRAYTEGADADGIPYYRGSANQRLIDVAASLSADRCVLYAPMEALRKAN